MISDGGGGGRLCTNVMIKACRDLIGSTYQRMCKATRLEGRRLQCLYSVLSRLFYHCFLSKGKIELDWLPCSFVFMLLFPSIALLCVL